MSGRFRRQPKRAYCGKRCPDPGKINLDIRKILDVSTVEWGVEVTLVELKGIQLPDTTKRAMARQAEAEREKRAKIINAQGESLAAAALGEASDIMMAHPLAPQPHNKTGYPLGTRIKVAYYKSNAPDPGSCP